MGCAASGKRRQLEDQREDAEHEVGALKRQLEEKNRELTSLRESQAAGDVEDTADDVAIVALRAELKEAVAENGAEEKRRQTDFEREFEILQQTALEEQERRSRGPGAVSSSSSVPRSQLSKKHSELDYVQKLEAAAAKRHREEADAMEKQMIALQDQLAPLQLEHTQALQDLKEAQDLLKAEHEGRGASTSVTASLERRLADCRSEHARAEQRWDDLERHLKQQMKELRSELQLRGNELRARDKHLQERDQELSEVNSQLADLQSLFDDVNQQLQTECGRIEQLQETVAVCAKQGKELESMQSMLEESHRVLAQMRDALEFERAEHAKVSELLEHEQQRTQLLLDVLKHFKEKLQGLTPQMLLSRLSAGASTGDIKALLSEGVSASARTNHGMAFRGQRPGTPQMPSESTGVAKAATGSSPSAFAGTGQGTHGSARYHPNEAAAWAQTAPSAMMRNGSAARTPSPAHARFEPSPSQDAPGMPPSSSERLLWDAHRGAQEPRTINFAAAGPRHGQADMGGDVAKAHANAAGMYQRM